MRILFFIVLLSGGFCACSLFTPLDEYVTTTASTDAGAREEADGPERSETGGSPVDGARSDASEGDAGTRGTRWEVNRHSYELVQLPVALSWNEAKDAASLRGGHLATITSIDESAFVHTVAVAATDGGWWIGGYQGVVGAPSEPDGGWEWVTDEPWGFTRWANGEPSNDEGVENYLHCLPSGRWNDMPESGNGQIKSYLVEYE